jgi:tetratricopeptide (TPR) repeat protein
MGRTGSRRGADRRRAEAVVRREVFQLVQRGRSALRSGRLREAEEALLRVLAADPFNRAALAGTAEVLLRKGEFAAACEAFERALEAGERTEHLLYAAGNACRGAQRREKAFKIFHELVELNPNHVKGLTRLGEGYLERKDFEGARERFEQALAHEPRNVYALRGLATALRGKRDYAAAIRVFEELARLDPADHRSLVRLGEARAHAGDRHGAFRAYAQALAVDPDNHYAREGLARLA